MMWAGYTILATDPYVVDKSIKTLIFSVTITVKKAIV